MPVNHKALLPLCRAGEPAFMQKANYRFDIPSEHLATRYKDVGIELLEQFNNDNVPKLPVTSINYPNLDYVKTFDKHAAFSVFIPKHKQYATALMKIFNTASNLDELISLALYVRDEINKQLFIYAYCSVLGHRFESENIIQPQLYEIAPECFFKKETLTKVRDINFHAPSTTRTARDVQHLAAPTEVVKIEFRSIASMHNPEEKMSYFREDIGVNCHHTHWHIVYPTDGPDPTYYNKSLRGELFTYMHHCLMNLYDLNRLSAGLPMLLPLENLRLPIDCEYFPNMTTTTSSVNIPPRQANTVLRDMYRDSNSIENTVSDLERWRERLYDAIDKGYIIDDKGQQIPIINDKGIDILGNLVESNVMSLNVNYYGNLHNMGHVMIGYAHDPNFHYSADGGVMVDTTTACHDPVFYRWHKMIDNIFTQLKSKMPAYQPKDLAFEGIRIVSLDFLDDSNKVTQQLITFWQQTIVDLQNGLDFHRNQPCLVQFIHLNRKEFTYSFQIENQNASPVVGTIRIFLLPLKDPLGQEYLFEGFRRYAVELDRFKVKFQPGMNKVHRKASDSAATIPLSRVYPMQRDGTVLLSDQPNEVQAVCMCGLPSNLLLPKGTVDGFPFQVFAMVSDYGRDQVDQPSPTGVCFDNYIYCGWRERKYPDARPMGYPFDRPADPSVSSFDDFKRSNKNMIMKKITIRHLDENSAQVGDDPTKIVNI